jgi:hypothetical protein
MYTAEPQIIPLLSPADIQSAGADLDSINTGKLNGTVKIILLIGAVTGDNPILLAYAGATAGTKTTEIPFRHRKASADTGAASADVFGARTVQAADGVGLALGVAATADLRCYVLEVDVDDMPDGKPWLTVFLDDGSASALFAAAVAIGSPRYSGDTHTTAL